MRMKEKCICWSLVFMFMHQFLFHLSSICNNIIKILGVTFTNNLSVNEHVHTVINSSMQTLYALRVLHAHGMDNVSLQTIYRPVIIAKLTYASSAWWRFNSASDLQRLELKHSSAEVIIVVLCQLTSQRLRTYARTPMRNCLMPLPSSTVIMFYLLPPQSQGSQH